MQMTDPSFVDGSVPIQSVKILLDFNASFGGERVVPKNLDGITSYSALCSEVKVKIQEQFGPFKDVRLIIGGSTLDDERPVGDYITEDNCRIVVMIRPSKSEFEKKLLKEQLILRGGRYQEYPGEPTTKTEPTTNTPSTRKKRCCIN